MKKIYSLIRACMTNDMNLFKIAKNKKRKSKITLPIILLVYIMFAMGLMYYGYFEMLSEVHLQHVLLTLMAFVISVMTLLEGIYKAGPILFNCKDDDLLLSLPIEKKTVIFVRIFKFYVFELLFNSMFFIPLIVTYSYWADKIYWSFYLTSFVMLFLLPIIPIIISCIIGTIISGLSSRFKHKNIVQIVLSMLFLLFIFYFSFKVNSADSFIIEYASTISNVVNKIYYPAYLYAELAIKFDLLKLLLFVITNIVLFVVFIIILSKFYFRINSKSKSVISTKTRVDKIEIKSKTQTASLIKKELSTFFKTPVFIVNSGFGLVLFLIAVIYISARFNSFINVITTQEDIGITAQDIINNISRIIYFLVVVTAFMTSITNSVISLEGRNINILKSLPVKVKTILMSKIYSCLLITTPVLFLGNIILFFRFKIAILDALFLLILSVLMPLVSHFIGILINLEYPKLDAQNSTEVVKQSTSSMLSVFIGMMILVANIPFVLGLLKFTSSTLFLFIAVIIYAIIDVILYLNLCNKGVKKFNSLTA